MQDFGDTEGDFLSGRVKHNELVARKLTLMFGYKCKAYRVLD